MFPICRSASSLPKFLVFFVLMLFKECLLHYYKQVMMLRMNTSQTSVNGWIASSSAGTPQSARP